MLREIIKEKRKRRGYTQSSLAEKLNVRRATISDYEAGKTDLRSSTLESIFEILRLEIRENFSDLKPLEKITDFDEFKNKINKYIDKQKNKEIRETFDYISKTFFPGWEEKDKWLVYLVPNEMFTTVLQKQQNTAGLTILENKCIYVKESHQSEKKEILIHETAHAVLPSKSGHGYKFKNIILDCIDKALDLSDEFLAFNLFLNHLIQYMKTGTIKNSTAKKLESIRNKAKANNFNFFLENFDSNLSLKHY